VALSNRGSSAVNKKSRTVAFPPTSRGPRRARLTRFRLALLVAGAAVFLFYASVCAALFALKWLYPPTTAVQAERHLHALVSGQPYRKRYRFVSLAAIGPNIQHAVLAAEDARFFQHHGFDWTEVRNAVRNDLAGGKPRGASTITQQLVRNLFLSTERSVVRKAVEFSMVPLAELILGKRRILELYLNVIEWGAGIYGADAASRFYFHKRPSAVNRNEAAELAAILPAPLTRRPGQPGSYVARILSHMREMGW
jgi:monofunctional biosynthetic peptidoglycan transglycosylase